MFRRVDRRGGKAAKEAAKPDEQGDNVSVLPPSEDAPLPKTAAPKSTKKGQAAPQSSASRADSSSKPAKNKGSKA